MNATELLEHRATTLVDDAVRTHALNVDEEYLEARATALFRGGLQLDERKEVAARAMQVYAGLVEAGDITPPEEPKPKRLTYPATREIALDLWRANPKLTGPEVYRRIAIRGKAKPSMARQSFLSGTSVSVRSQLRQEGVVFPKIRSGGGGPKKASSDSDKHPWSKIIEESGIKVRIYERPGSKMLWGSVADGHGKKARRSLNTKDRALAETRARNVAREIAAAELSKNGVGRKATKMIERINAAEDTRAVLMIAAERNGAGLSAADAAAVEEASERRMAELGEGDDVELSAAPIVPPAVVEPTERSPRWARMDMGQGEYVEADDQGDGTWRLHLEVTVTEELFRQIWTEMQERMFAVEGAA